VIIVDLAWKTGNGNFGWRLFPVVFSTTIVVFTTKRRLIKVVPFAMQRQFWCIARHFSVQRHHPCLNIGHML